MSLKALTLTTLATSELPTRPSLHDISIAVCRAAERLDLLGDVDIVQAMTEAVANISAAWFAKARTFVST